MELKITSLSKTYSNGVKALNNVNLTISTGMYGLLGPNGAGKSTLMRTIATLQEADSGTVRLGVLDVLKEKLEVRKLLGYLPQEFGVYPKVSAYDMLEHIAILKGISVDRKTVVEDLLKRVNLWDVRKKALGGFSGGMKQRFGIAQALLGDPKLIIVDEPTAGLDPGERNRFYNLLSEIGEQVIVILSTHIVDDVKELCSQMAIIDKGTVLFEGSPMDALTSIDGKIWRREVSKQDIPAFTEKYPVISTRMVAGKPLAHVYSDHSPDADFDSIQGDLEDVFFTHIKGFRNQ
ncbi:MAG: ABC transporter ATP-binding protein [Bacteroidia bacterium]|jgi:ABC-2 type transport system ATP-binding protein|nr:ABC transporter ATP-binding protein [Bacteroidota bacterium]MBP6512946.1 ABC transporter ATP-binding protein [Bacteroidia bacterium]MBP7244241.1 ABC transporter ATP-binding protein [Bacteroidia bacterium]